MTTHGASDAGGKHKADRLYRIWKAMKWRCNAKNRTEDYHLYYERGIRVCEQWLHSYETFRDWAIENGYKDNLSIDRFPDKMGIITQQIADGLMQKLKQGIQGVIAFLLPLEKQKP